MWIHFFIIMYLPIDIISTRICKFKKRAAKAAVMPETTVAISGVSVSGKIGLKNLE